MADVASRELRNNTRALLERVEAGEEITITVDGRDADSRSRRLQTLLIALSLDPIPVDDPVAEAWARLQVNLRE